jgi:pilus assembly protein CpaF
MVNSPSEIFFEKDGVLHQSPFRFRDNAHIMRVADRIVAPLGRRLDESSPMVDARLPDGSRVNIVIPPIAVKSPSISIRKFRTDRFDVDDLIRIGSLTEQVAGFLRAAVHSKVNVVISGGTGSGKTTLLNALSAFIPRQERIVTIEDPIEIQLRQPHVVSLEARPPTGESTTSVTQRDLVRNALRMRPDRIIVGEVRGSEAFDMLQAMNTGHEGSITTVHANTPRDALSRVENMVMMAGFDLSVRTIREQMASALHMIIQVSRLSDGSRRVMNVTEVVGMEGDVITVQDIFRFEGQRLNDHGKVEGQLVATGIRPAFADEFRKFGISEVWAGSTGQVSLR